MWVRILLTVAVVALGACDGPVASPAHEQVSPSAAWVLPAATAGPSARPASTPIPTTEPAQLEFTQDLFDFGVVPVGGEAIAQLEISNLSAGAVSGLVAGIRGRVNGGFTLARLGDACPVGRLAAGASCSLAVRFSPAALGRLPGQLFVASAITESGVVVEARVWVSGEGSSPVSRWSTSSIPVASTNGGAGLGVATGGGRTYVNAVVSNLEEVLDGWDASAAIQSRDAGRRWRRPLILGGSNPSMAAAGRHVYIALAANRCGVGVGFLRNADYGRRGRWSQLRCLAETRSLQSEDAPLVAATDHDVYVATVLPKPRRVVTFVSHDRGRTWKRTALGRMGTDGMILDVAADDRVVGVLFEAAGGSVLRLSADRGRTWLPADPVGTASSLSIRDGRIAVSGSLWGISPIRVRNVDGPWRDIPPPDLDVVLDGTRIGHAELGPGNAIAVIRRDPARENDELDCLSSWNKTEDDGRTWSERDLLPGCTQGPTVWLDDGRVFILADDSEGGYVLVTSPGNP